MQHFYEDVEGWFGDPLDKELYDEVVEMAQNESHFVEVGSYKGKSTCLMAVNIINSGKKIVFDSVDNFSACPGDEFANNIKPVMDYVNPVKGDSVEVAKSYKDSSLDFVFIDADHAYESVKNNLHAWFPKLKGAAIFAGHDYGNPTNGVKQAVDEFFKNANFHVEQRKHIWVVNMGQKNR